MTKISMALLELLGKHGLEDDVDVFRKSMRLYSRAIMELEVSEQVGASWYEWSDGRQIQLNGYRDWIWERAWAL